MISSVQARLRQWFSGTAAGVSVAPTGAGPPMGRGLSLLLSQIGADALVPLLIDRLKQAASQEERLHYLFALRNQREGWTPPARETYFAALHALEQTALGGEGMPGFLRRIRSEATATLTEAEARQLKELLQPSSNGPDDPPLRVDRPVVRHWSLDDLQDLLSKAPRPPDRARGRELFEEVLCIQCHRSGNRGGVTGPDLTSVARRFSRRDLLTSILAPSEVIADTYRNLEILTRSGQVVTGRVLTGGDYRSPTLRIATDPLKPFEVREIPKSEIEWHRPSPQSPMPKGLLDSLTAAEIRDLLAYLESLAWDPQQ